MEDFISISVSSFIHFLSGKEDQIQQIGADEILISFAVQLNDFSYPEKLNSLLSTDSIDFFFEHPSENFSFAGLNAALQISHNGSNRFSAEQKINEWQNKFVHNREVISSGKIPLFVGGMKFTHNDNSEMWKNFDDAFWFVPEILFLNKNEEIYLIYNFILKKKGERESYHERYKIALIDFFSKDFRTRKDILPGIEIIENEKTGWIKLVDESLTAIHDNQFKKVVLSRYIKSKLSDKPSFKILINNLKETYPDCYTFLLRRADSYFFGSTPEKLAGFSNGKIEIDVLAGSAKRGITVSEDEHIANKLLKDEKNLNEHRLVAEHVKNSLSKFTNEIIAGELSIRKLENIQHLYTPINAEISSGSIFTIIEELYPTPAICGYPKDSALKYIAEKETYSRGFYAGIIGWLNFEDEAEFVVAIRSALIQNNELFAFAGCGIVNDSIPEDELRETELKLKPILSLFKNEN